MSFHDINLLLSHQKNHRLEENRCKVCLQKIVRKKASVKHTNDVHPKANPSTCKRCSKNYKTKKVLLSNLKMHAKKLYKCTICHADFTTKEKLLQHNREHEILQPPTQFLQQQSMQAGPSTRNVHQPCLHADHSTQNVQKLSMQAGLSTQNLQEPWMQAASTENVQQQSIQLDPSIQKVQQPWIQDDSSIQKV
ncbi:gastrula zinc finger protein XlCGF26.1-like [Centruroides sculpturatus]|uniref:gastrula zinc finger protein XlCGF26.1-like n=1 Tax=Centruroides sculpturatus TaxID=218467 RepID=UPI000C6D0DE9|nr:gastrula zinc finger protein XlCGF26.1-like [Centruroides sculpturatus]